MVTYWILGFTKILECQTSDILEPDRLPTAFHILERVKISNISETTENFTDLYRIQSLAFELISLAIEINPRYEAEKAASDFTASIVSTYRLPTRKFTPSDINNEIPCLYHLLKHK
jgi:hypothetical protein